MGHENAHFFRNDKHTQELQEEQMVQQAYRVLGCDNHSFNSDHGFGLRGVCAIGEGTQLGKWGMGFCTCREQRSDDAVRQLNTRLNRSTLLASLPPKRRPISSPPSPRLLL